MRIIFMGTPQFAASSLKRLYEDGHEIVAVFTQPDKPKGRGHKVVMPPVKELALLKNTPVFQPVSLKSDEVIKQVSDLSPDIIVVVAYGRILPQKLLNIPKYGAINLHGSLLPKHRGASPIQQAIISGDKVTGVCTIHLTSEMDAGDIIYCQETKIDEYETSDKLFERLADIGAKLLSKTVEDIGSNLAPRTPQDSSKATYTKQLSKNDSKVDWSKSSKEIVNLICGLEPWPCASACIDSSELKIFSPRYTDTKTNKAPGTVVKADKNGIEIACGGGETVLITEVQAAGKRRMAASDWLLGHPIEVDAL